MFVMGVIREWWRHERERRGLLRLLLAEIEHNAEVARTIVESGKPSLIGSPDVRLMKTQTWQDTRVRAAQLLPDDLLTVLQGYYSPLETLLTLLGFADFGKEVAERNLRRIFAEELGEDFPRSRDPWIWHARTTIEAQDLARQLIVDHLEEKRSPLGDRLTVAVVQWLQHQQQRRLGSRDRGER